TAGKAVLFSGLTVAIGLMGMLFFTDTSLPSFGIGGTIAVSLAVLFSLTLLPAILSYLGTRVNAGKVPFVPTATDKDDGFWGTIARAVMAHPLIVLIPILILLIGAGLPFLQASFGMVTYESLPPDDEARQGIERENEVWSNSSSDNSLLIVVEFDEEIEWRDPAALEVLYNLSKVVNETDGVKRTQSVAWMSPDMDADVVKMLWGTPIEMLPPELASLRALMESASENTANGSIAIIFTDLDGRANTDASKDIVNKIRDIRGQFEHEPVVDRILVGGFAAYNVDTLNLVSDHLLEAMLFIFVATFILVFIQVQSVVIPLKAILMNFLSITASFGMLVYVFQQGHGTDFLNVTPAPIDPINPVLMFCIVFGLSMDYEVLMLSRIHEEWERTGDNVQAVAMGLQRTGRLITGAAAVMVIVFLAFGTSSMTMVKQIGLGLALAIAIDATLVRALVVPAAMRLMGRANWWSPRTPWSRPDHVEQSGGSSE
ncbi:MAG TPA: MMPL family transporter, partial [Candidatus Poseidoniales archaeon]|nr:MMPL family transporter [Candidatus Poseidoniales archaeon]